MLSCHFYYFKSIAISQILHFKKSLVLMNTFISDPLKDSSE